jgi:K+-sensing histidine kinase KdpD
MDVKRPSPDPPVQRQPRFRATDEHDPQSSVSMRDLFLDILSHELRTPITAIYVGSQVLAARTLDRERTRVVANDILVEAERLVRLVEDLLVLGRLDGGSLTAESEPVAIGQTILEAIDRQDVIGDGVNIGFSGRRDATAPAADRSFVLHVVRNLLDNAIRFGGSRPVDVVVEVDAAEIGVRVLDRGVSPGIGGPEAFEITARIPAAPAQQAGGGIGLFVAGRLVTAMGGRVWAVPRDGGGSEFGFALPAH